MDESNSIRVPVTCECGAKQEIPIAGKDLETLEFTCPGCGSVDRFTPDQIVTILAQYESAKVAAVEYARASISDAIKRATRGSKHLKYRPKR